MGRFCTHGAPGSGSLPERIGARAHVPHRSDGSARVPVAQRRAEHPPAFRAKPLIHSLPGAQARAVHVLPHRQARRGALQPPMIAPITSWIVTPALACGRLRGLLPDAETGTGGPSPCAWATSDAFPILTDARHFNSVQDVTTRRPVESGRPLNRTAFFPPLGVAPRGWANRRELHSSVL